MCAAIFRSCASPTKSINSARRSPSWRGDVEVVIKPVAASCLQASSMPEQAFKTYPFTAAFELRNPNRPSVPRTLTRAQPCKLELTEIASNALRSVSCRNTKPLLKALLGMTRCPPSKSSSAKSPATCCSNAAGIRNSAGRCRRRPSSSVNLLLVTGIGAVALIGPEISGFASACPIRRIEIVALDPGHPLLARSHRTAKTEFERRQHARQQSALGADARGRCAGKSPSRRIPPRRLAAFSHAVAQFVAEACMGLRGFRQRLILPQPVPADRRAR